jgi:hypothetical protein
VPLGLGHWVVVLGAAALPSIAGLLLAGLGVRVKERVTYLKV